MDHGSTGGGSSGGGDGDLDSGIEHGGGTKSASFGNDDAFSKGDIGIYGGTKTFIFPAPFIEIPYIVVSPASGNSYKTSNDASLNPPTAWYHDESTVGFIAELSTAAVKLTWIAIGKWK